MVRFPGLSYPCFVFIWNIIFVCNVRFFVHRHVTRLGENGLTSFFSWVSYRLVLWHQPQVIARLDLYLSTRILGFCGARQARIPSIHIYIYTCILIAICLRMVMDGRKDNPWQTCAFSAGAMRRQWRASPSVLATRPCLRMKISIWFSKIILQV